MAIYVLITTSLRDIYNGQGSREREQWYKRVIPETLKNIPKEMTPIIVNSDEMGPTFLEDFGVQVVYTGNQYVNMVGHKGVRELKDVKDAIKMLDIQPEDTVIKITGRYEVYQDDFFQLVLKNYNEYDVFIKFMNVCAGRYDRNDSILGMYAMKAQFLLEFEFDPNAPSPEMFFANWANNMERKRLIKLYDVEERLHIIIVLYDNHSRVWV